MPQTEVLLFAEEDGSCPFLEWLDGLPSKVQDKCYVRIERLEEMGHELRRPEADYLRDGIHELRASFRGIHYRILYFFAEQGAIISHGTIKEQKVPEKAIDLTIARMNAFNGDPLKHTYEGRADR